MAEGAKQICVGLLAHVDAGKTTLSEAMLYLSGRLKKLGRVDHRDSFLDTHSLERQRGITIFSKQAVFPLGDKTVTLLDTPGHVDFSAEMERALGVMDCAVLVISGTDGVQAHTETLWRLLERRGLPCLIFVTKMDLARQDKRHLMEELKTRLDPRCADFTLRGEVLQEELAMTGEKLMDEILSGSIPDRKRLSGALRTRELFPVFFGSGLKLDGVEALLEALHDLVEPPEDRGAFSARVFKIARDPQGNRLSFLRVLSGELKVRSPLRYEDEAGQQLEEKITQLRIYSGAKYETAETLFAGQLGAALGLSGTWPGQGLGEASDSGRPALEPVMSYRLLLPYGADPAQWMPRLRVLGEEDPQLHLRWNERLRQIELRLMGRVQAEVFRSLVKERFDLDVGLSEGRVLYRETIADTVEGVGHFEPLRHYAEVHLILEPLPRDSGVVADSVCPEDSLDRNWQRLILGHVLEKHHLGVLTGSPITDVKITLAAGRAHLKHTEGGDFRQATYRAIRQGLMKAESVLLEPWYTFILEVPPDQIGQAISDVRAMNGVFEAPEEDGELVRLRGSAPVAAMNAYGDELQSYTHGRGRLSLRPEGYRPVKEQEKLVSSFGYDPTADLENTPDSVFCAHGAGFNVRWDQVEQYMHLDSALAAPVPGRGAERGSGVHYHPGAEAVCDRGRLQRDFCFRGAQAPGLGEAGTGPGAADGSAVQLCGLYQVPVGAGLRRLPDPGQSGLTDRVSQHPCGLHPGWGIRRRLYRAAGGRDRQKLRRARHYQRFPDPAQRPALGRSADQLRRVPGRVGVDSGADRGSAEEIQSGSASDETERWNKTN